MGSDEAGVVVWLPMAAQHEPERAVAKLSRSCWGPLTASVEGLLLIGGAGAGHQIQAPKG